MLYQIRSEERTAGTRTGPVYTLSYGEDRNQIEIWTAHGFNCLRWRMQRGGKTRDLLYAAPDWEVNPVPSRSGIPILFPFPNRIRDGKVSFSGETHQLPLNDSTKQHAIHGFAARNAWRVIDSGCDGSSAWIKGVFQPSVDAPEVLPFWTGDYILEIQYILKAESVTIESKVLNLTDAILPWGLGYHPYFTFPSLNGDEDIGQNRVLMPSRAIWELTDSFPTGNKLPIPGPLNWDHCRKLGSTQLDTLYTELGIIDQAKDGMLLRAELRHTAFRGALKIWTSIDFREMVLFTPVHRKAICIEPYTCATDFLNLHERGIDAGIQILPPNSQWNGKVELVWDDSATDI